MVSGDSRTDLAWMQAGGGDWVAKIGADAVQAIGIRSAGIGIAIKVADGAVRALHPATYAVLDQLGLLDDTRRKHLAPYRAPPIKNARGIVAGDIHAVFTLSKPGSDPDFGQFPKTGSDPGVKNSGPKNSGSEHIFLQIRGQSTFSRHGAAAIFCACRAHTPAARMAICG
jgi:hypothetical protein